MGRRRALTPGTARGVRYVERGRTGSARPGPREGVGPQNVRAPARELAALSEERVGDAYRRDRAVAACLSRATMSFSGAPAHSTQTARSPA